MQFVDLSKHQFVIEPRYYYFGWAASHKILAQQELAGALRRAKDLLPPGYNFKVWDCKRPRIVQLKMLDSFRRRIKQLYPKLGADEREKLLLTFAAKPSKVVIHPDTHRHGGAIDLTIINDRGEELYMGTDHDNLTEKAFTNHFEKKKKLSLSEREARDNRRLLIEVLTKVGFENYYPEWWHWSYKQEA